MQHTLLNPNQLQSFGILVKNDPFASGEPIRIESENGDDVLPLHTEGTIIYLDIWTLKDEDLSQLPHITMASSHPWNPREVQFPKTSRHVEEELTMRSIASATTDHGMSPSLSDRWVISVAQVALTLKATTQKYVRSALLPLAR